jgi:hypothetical protein
MRIREKVAQVQRGEVSVEEVPGSTTERMAIGLILNALGLTNPSFDGDQRGAWERLDHSQRTIVQDLNPEYRKKKWLTAEDKAMADPEVKRQAAEIVARARLKLSREQGDEQ